MSAFDSPELPAAPFEPDREDPLWQIEAALDAEPQRVFFARGGLLRRKTFIVVGVDDWTHLFRVYRHGRVQLLDVEQGCPVVHDSLLGQPKRVRVANQTVRPASDDDMAQAIAWMQGWEPETVSLPPHVEHDDEDVTAAPRPRVAAQRFLTQRSVGVLLIGVALLLTTLGLFIWRGAAESAPSDPANDREIVRGEWQGRSPTFASSSQTDYGRAVAVWVGAGVILLIGVACLSGPGQRR